jgi:hypothetical protein
MMSGSWSTMGPARAHASNDVFIDASTSCTCIQRHLCHPALTLVPYAPDYTWSDQ